jgi:DNA-directed RNA polymerase subunit RPC12/RpoP
MTFLEILLLIIIGAVAIRFSFKFDLNKFLENQRKIKLNQLKNICPHLQIFPKENNIIIESYFSSPFGTTKYICSQCGCIVESEEEVNRLQEPYKQNPRLYLNRQKEFIKNAKKLKLI